MEYEMEEKIKKVVREMMRTELLVRQGVQGIQGIQGKQGIQGVDGKQGPPGKPGKDGAVGQPGRAGVDLIKTPKKRKVAETLN